MQTAIVHAPGTGGDLPSRVYHALCRIWPDAALCMLDLHARVPQPVTLLPMHNVVVSTSPFAAQQVAVGAQALHACYVAPVPGETAHDSHPAASPALRTVGTSLLPSSSALLSAGHVTHVLAASHAIGERHRPEVGAHLSVIAPPIDTSFFRPDMTRREDFYLYVTRDGTPAELELAIAGCCRADRRLIVAALDDCRTTVPFPPHVTVSAKCTPAGLRALYRRCQGVLITSGSEFCATAAEALACGTPVIALDSPGAREMLRDVEDPGQGTGIFFDRPDSVSLASAIEEAERRPQKFSASLAIAQAAHYSAPRFEHAIGTWLAEQLAAAGIRDLATEPRHLLPIDPAANRDQGKPGRGRAAA